MYLFTVLFDRLDGHDHLKYAARKKKRTLRKIFYKREQVHLHEVYISIAIILWFHPFIITQLPHCLNKDF